MARSGPFEGWKGLEGATELLAARRPVAFFEAYTRSLCFGPGADSARLRHGAPAADYGRRGRRRADIRGALAQTLTGGGLDLVGEAANAQDAVRLVLDVRPDIVLMDLRLPDSPGVQAIEQLALIAPASRILILTRTEQNRVVEAIVVGASGYILKTAPPERSSPPSGQQPPENRSSPPRSPGSSCNASANATYPSPPPRERRERDPRRPDRRELEIFERFASGRSNHDIARELSLSTNTVQNHVASILAKLHLDNRIQAAVQRTQRHLLTRGDRAEPRVLSATAIARLRSGK